MRLTDMIESVNRYNLGMTSVVLVLLKIVFYPVLTEVIQVLLRTVIWIGRSAIIRSLT